MIDGIANTGAQTYVGEKQKFSYRHTCTCALTFHVTFPREAMELIKLLSKGVSSYP
jgi:hypothetical protein